MLSYVLNLVIDGGPDFSAQADVTMVNEVLCKIICHNICVLIQESHELGISTAFWAETSPAQEVPVN